MQKKVEGIVISTVDYKENSKIVNILTKDDGIIGVIARGSKSLKNHLRNTTTVLCYGTFYLSSRSNFLPVITEVDITNYFKEIRKDMLKMNYSLLLLELTSQVYKNNSDNNIYKILIDGLGKINEGYDPSIITNIIEIKLLDKLGIMPNLECCVNCHSKNNIITISSYKGGYICSNCIDDEYRYDLKTLKLLKMFYYVDLKNISKVDVSDNIKNELNIFLDDYYERYSGLYLKSKKFLVSLSNI